MYPSNYAKIPRSALVQDKQVHEAMDAAVQGQRYKLSIALEDRRELSENGARIFISQAR